jgi:pyrroline-5-carboxylate reductase
MESSLVIVGGGNMGAALLRGVAGAIVAEPDPARRAAVQSMGAAVVSGVGEALRASHADAMVVLAIKPQVFSEVAAEAWGELGGRLVLSIMAGVTLERLRRELGTDRVVRSMPNLPAAIGRGITAIAREGGTREDRQRAVALLRGVGQTIEIDEGLMDAFTAVAGSGPAYVFHLAEAMVCGAEAAGFDHSTATAIVRRTLAGAAEMLAEDPREPDQLRAAVTSTGGTTAAALGVLEGAGWCAATSRAILAARDRGRELGD